jgi:transketolase
VTLQVNANLSTSLATPLAAPVVAAPYVVNRTSGLTAFAIRKIILEQSLRAGVGHVGSALSIAEIVACLYNGILNVSSPFSDDRDRFILSKGHAALALYAALALRGWISAEQLNSFCGNGTLLGVHPEHKLVGVDFSSGSLGQGLSFATGLALAAKKQHMQHKLDNLVVIVDNNQQQAFGQTKDVLDLSPLDHRWGAFGWDVLSVDGHDMRALHDALSSFIFKKNQPHVLIAHTIFGKGVSFMERQLKWHYSPLSEAQFKQAMAEVEGRA